VRFVYLDESGIGSQKSEPFVVVAGVIVHADNQLKAIEQHLHKMVETHVHPLLQKFSCFHAKELFNGGTLFTRERYPRESRWAILEELCSIPNKFDLPVVVGVVDREEYKSITWRKDWKPKDLASGAQMLASIVCMIAAEKYLRKYSPGEVAALIYENNDTAKTLIKNAQRMLKDGDVAKILGPNFIGPRFWSYLPLTKIAEDAFFSEKRSGSLLQVADAVAWAVNRKLRNDTVGDRFFAGFDKQINIIRPRAFGPIPASRVEGKPD